MGVTQDRGWSYFLGTGALLLWMLSGGHSCDTDGQRWSLCVVHVWVLGWEVATPSPWLCSVSWLYSSLLSCNWSLQEVSYLWEILVWKQVAYSWSHKVLMAGKFSQELHPHPQLHSDGSKHRLLLAPGSELVGWTPSKPQRNVLPQLFLALCVMWSDFRVTIYCPNRDTFHSKRGTFDD